MSVEEEEDESRDIMPNASPPLRATSPPSGLRNRPLARAATFAEAAPRFARRGSSFVSETLSESRRSLKESTDDILLPRAHPDHDGSLETSNWHSLPLGLALLPAIAGVFFQNGNAFVTDISLLGLAALFLNWAVRLPWDWYLSAQAIISETEQGFEAAVEDEVSEAGAEESATKSRGEQPILTDRALRAQHELRVHEFLALCACFAFPIMGAWLLHAIRTQLSSRSESLISNYNLTIFILASEVRPLSHLIKLVQRRTLFLQRTISIVETQKTSERMEPKVSDLSKRVDELEAHVADSVMISSHGGPGSPSGAQDLIAQASSHADATIRKSLQPEIDALSRAMRRHEKGKMTYAIQVESRLQDIEAKLADVVILAAATQRNADNQRGKYTPILANWVSACVVVPVQYAIYVLTIPQRTLSTTNKWLKNKLGFVGPSTKSKVGKTSGRLSSGRKRSKERTKNP